MQENESMRIENSVSLYITVRRPKVALMTEFSIWTSQPKILIHP